MHSKFNMVRNWNELPELEQEFELEEFRQWKAIRDKIDWEYELFRKYPESYQELHPN